MDSQFSFATETLDQCDLVAPLCVAPTTSLRETVRLMKERNSAAVLVCRDEVVVGIFTERDALKLMAGDASFDLAIERVMTRDPVVLYARDTVGRAITAMTRGGYRRVPIVDDQGRPIGIIKVEGILHYLAEHFPTVIYNLPPEPHHTTQEREGA